MSNTDKKPVSDLTMANYSEMVEAQLSVEKIQEEKRKASALFITSYKFSEPLKANTALTRKEKKTIEKALKKHNDEEMAELFEGDELIQMQKTKVKIKIDMTNDQKEVVFDALSNLRNIDEPSDLPLSEIFIFVDLVIGRTYHAREFEGN